MLQQEIWLLTSIKLPFQVEFPRLHEKIEFSQYPPFEIGVGHASLLPGDVLNLTGSHNSHVFLPPSIKPSLLEGSGRLVTYTKCLLMVNRKESGLSSEHAPNFWLVHSLGSNSSSNYCKAVVE